MTIRFLFAQAQIFWRELLLVGTLAVLGSLASLAVPWFAAQLLGGLFDNTQQALATISWLLAGTVVVTALLRIATEIASSWTSWKILAALRSETHNRILFLPMSFHDRSSRGDLQALMNYEVSHLSAFLSNTLANLPANLITAAGATLLLFMIDPAIAIALPVMIGAGYITARLVGRRLRGLATQVQRAEARLYSFADQHLQMLPAIKSFALEQQHQASYAEAVDQSRDLMFRESRITAFFSPLVGLVAALAIIAIIVFAGAEIESGERTASDVFSFLLYAALLTRPIGSLAGIYGNFQLAKGTLARLEGAFEQEIEPGHDATTLIASAKGEIVFCDISFAYPERGVVLDKANLRIRSGETIALTGENGAGKTTLVRLLLRFYELDGGQITIDGQDITQCHVQSLRRQFGYVPQRPLLFNASVKDNITFSDPKPDEDRLARAIALSQSGFVQNLPSGLDTQIGDHGVRLSGGQRQRIALARAMYRDPPIYILDEATSMYDLGGEASLVEACNTALADRTVIIITHRQASLKLADRVFDVSEKTVREIQAV